jgi:hypothetical protein
MASVVLKAVPNIIVFLSSCRTFVFQTSDSAIYALWMLLTLNKYRIAGQGDDFKEANFKPAPSQVVIITIFIPIITVITITIMIINYYDLDK